MEALLPREVDDLDPKSQLQLALRLASRAFSLSEAALQQENQRLRARLSAREAAAAALEESAAALRSDAAGAAERERLAAEAAARAREESRGLAAEVRRLRAEVAKAEGVRRALLRSLGGGGGLGVCGAAGGGGGEGLPGEQTPAGAGAAEVADGTYPSYDFECCSTTLGVLGARAKAANDSAGFAAVENDTDDGGGDNNNNNNASARRIPASWKKPSNSPSTTTATMTGKEFFRAARARLPAARFEDLMNAVRALNGGRASRTSALAAAAEALGGQGGGCADLVPVFEGLLSQRVPVD